MIILKSMFHDDSVAVVNFYVYDHLVPSLKSDEPPSLEVYDQVTSFMSATLDLFKQGQTVEGEVLIELLENHLPGLLPFMHDSSVTHVTPQAAEFPYEEFNSGTDYPFYHT